MKTEDRTLRMWLVCKLGRVTAMWNIGGQNKVRYRRWQVGDEYPYVTHPNTSPLPTTALFVRENIVNIDGSLLSIAIID